MICVQNTSDCLDWRPRSTGPEHCQWLPGVIIKPDDTKW